MKATRRNPFALACTALALLAAGALRPASAAEPQAQSPFTFVPKVSVLRPQALVRSGRASATSAAYTVVDDGTLPAGTEALYGPVAFNNADQIVGNAYNTSSYVPECVLFDGARYRDVSTLPSITSCGVNAISQRSATGTVALVGSVTTDVSAGDTKALYIATLPNTQLLRTAVFSNDDSSLSAIDASGKALGSAEYDPLGGFVTTRPPFVVLPGGGSLAVLQPSCILPAAGCGELPAAAFNSDFVYPSSCGFGGCFLAADGTALLYDLFAGSFELVAPSGTARDVALDANLVSVPFMNDAKQIVYAAEMVIAGATVIRTQYYSATTGAVTTLPPLPGKTCSQYVPLSMNNAGRILGDANCADGFIYFTYDPASGIAALPAALPGDFSFQPFAINDNDQILVQIVHANGGPVDWGYLQPAATARALARRSAPPDVRVPGPGSRTRIPAGRALAFAPRATRVATPSAARGPVRRPIALARYVRRAAASLYTLIDYGAPPASGYTLENPVAFNNGGQIVGLATDVPYRSDTACLIYDGGRFRNLAPGSVDCEPYGLNDVNPRTGKLDIVGWSTSAFDIPYGEYAPGKAFESVFAPASGALSTRRFPANDQSTLLGVNPSGAAIGTGYYTPAGGQNTELQFELAAGASAPSLLPQCLSSSGCGNLRPQPCGFGGCFIAPDGTLLLSSVLVSPSGSETFLNFLGGDFSAILNDNGQILYYNYISEDTLLYDVATKTSTPVPHVAGSTCQIYRPLSFNNAGHVLGEMSAYCAAGANDYFIYDPVNGTRDLATLLPPGTATVTPVAINDADDILVEITLPDGVNHWGVLKPPATTRGRPATAVRSRLGI